MGNAVRRLRTSRRCSAKLRPRVPGGLPTFRYQYPRAKEIRRQYDSEVLSRHRWEPTAEPFSLQPVSLAGGSPGRRPRSSIWRSPSEHGNWCARDDYLQVTGNISRFDHAVIAVADLDSAVETYRGLGFEVGMGGRHAGRGTHNAIIRFGLDYVELIAIHDADLGRAHGGNVNALISYLERTGGGPLGFALAAPDLQAVASAWRSRLTPVAGPVDMERVRPDGIRLRWRLLIPSGSAWRRPWPFLIQWETPDRERLERDAGGRHRNGANGVAGVTVVVRSVHDILPLYVRDLGLAVEAERVSEGSLAARGTRLRLGSFRIDLLEPSGYGAAADALERDGEGLFQIEIGVIDIHSAAALVRVEPGEHSRIVIPSERACGAHLVLVARN